jgi:tripartite-type tricarboxylate transporter receptor subunit TctC
MPRVALMPALAFALLGPGVVRAQDYPNHPVKIVVPIGPSGSYDILGRLVADQLSRRLNQSFVVENRPGGGTMVGTKAVIAAEQEG